MGKGGEEGTSCDARVGRHDGALRLLGCTRGIIARLARFALDLLRFSPIHARVRLRLARVFAHCAAVVVGRGR